MEGTKKERMKEREGGRKRGKKGEEKEILSRWLVLWDVLIYISSLNITEAELYGINY